MFGFFYEKFQKFPKMYLGVQVSKTLGRLIVQTFTTHVSNHSINFPMCTECKKGQKPIMRPKLRIRKVLHCSFKIIKFLILIIIASRPYLLNFLLGAGNKVLINVGLINHRWSILNGLIYLQYCRSRKFGIKIV